ncbi:uncharacterized protein LOC119382531 [Rhipicephalus sanguineus]|uniref:Uncharacterized protein n=1 Tax=Rhipicephalus sanguineus TaxID=34632 RepID=A0A9D4Q5Q8_RHISA|nr:uncharacterized protein LOC119382531 [Rhipicephalus sanguineus]KAH7968784.1 hypothetical protein HPB52_011286 [Rhipicephalus sanguineus]
MGGTLLPARLRSSSLVLVTLAPLVALAAAVAPPDWSAALDHMERRGGSLSNPKLQSWPLLSIMPGQGALESLQLRSRQRQHSPSYSVEGDDDGGLDSQDESRRAKLRGKACYFKICPFNTRAL